MSRWHHCTALRHTFLRVNFKRSLGRLGNHKLNKIKEQQKSQNEEKKKKKKKRDVVGWVGSLISPDSFGNLARTPKNESWHLLPQPTPKMSPSDRIPARHATVRASLRSETSLKYGLPHCLGPHGSRSPVSQASVRTTVEIVRAGRRTGGFLWALGWKIGACEGLLPFDHYSRKKCLNLWPIGYTCVGENRVN